MAELYHEKGDLSMAIRTYLAMTAAEFAMVNPRPSHIAWMACHFSPYGTGLSNLPSSLPPDSLLILNDRIPICGHDPQRVTEQLKNTTVALGCCGVLLDFQQELVPEIRVLAARLVEELPCPVAVSEPYAWELDCPVFLSPCPHHIPLEQHIAPWLGRRLWLDLAVNAETITLTTEGSRVLPLPLRELPSGGHRENLLHCHYSIEAKTDSAQFTFWRTTEDLETLAAEAEALGAEVLVGLFCESGNN